ncbi:helicase associated domain-containing protein [Streptomyces sp. H27-G5]|uniref:helicase associated domain-containing protein n=1 Tax=Streptomyces sp. H27-G5 TaxID=2996698 RepID=UPI002271EF30|nr:helicase associated domain-containing protein [Streptomyces sp. H27-G5]MCY0924413.1 helicase associated domain-containing protein [Streptomyces sp. H27-G5]
MLRPERFAAPCGWHAIPARPDLVAEDGADRTLDEGGVQRHPVAGQAAAPGSDRQGVPARRCRPTSASPPPPAGGARPAAPVGGQCVRPGVEALAQYAAPEGHVIVPRAHTEVLPGRTAVRLGLWLSNTRSRRDGLSAEQRERLADLGIDWAR